MKIVERFAALFGPRLRNKREGLAWIKPFGADYGADVLAGRIVRTVAVVHSSAWQIDPPQCFIVAGAGVHFVFNGVRAAPGQSALITAMSDELLEPIPKIGDFALDESARWLPPVPALRSKESA